jgi:hypothetical protein
MAATPETRVTTGDVFVVETGSGGELRLTMGDVLTAINFPTRSSAPLTSMVLSE